MHYLGKPGTAACDQRDAPDRDWGMPSTFSVAVSSETRSKPLHKDEVPDRLSKRWNVAQFVAFRPQASGYDKVFKSRQIALTPPFFFFLMIALSVLLTLLLHLLMPCLRGPSAHQFSAAGTIQSRGLSVSVRPLPSTSHH